MKHLSLCLAVALSVTCSVAMAATMVDDFSGGVVAANHPEGAGVYGTYYDITNDAYATASDGGGILRIDDGGFTNGVYVIYEAVIPADGVYSLSALVDVENNGSATSFDRYQVVAVVNGVHRGLNPSDLPVPDPSDPGTGVGTLDFTATVNPAAAVVTSGTFSANAGDDLLVAFSTDLVFGDDDLVLDGNYDYHSRFLE